MKKSKNTFLLQSTNSEREAKLGTEKHHHKMEEAEHVEVEERKA